MSREGIGTRQADEEILHMLDLRDHDNLTSTQISRRTGRTRSAVCGAMNRTDRERDPYRIGEGTMPRKWWAK